MCVTEAAENKESERKSGAISATGFSPRTALHGAMHHTVDPMAATPSSHPAHPSPKVSPRTPKHKHRSADQCPNNGVVEKLRAEDGPHHEVHP